MSSVNLVKVFFYAGNTISKQRKQALVALAYATARDRMLAPKAILIRSEIHDTTTLNGQHTKDPKGWHGTFAFKDSEHVQRELHVASHGYTNGKEDFVLKKATHAPEKLDATRKRSGRAVWPDEDELEEYGYSPIGFCHMLSSTQRVSQA